MAVSQNRKRKFKGGDMKADKGKDAETTVVNLNEIEVTKSKNKKHKKNIIAVVPIETSNDNVDISEAKKVKSVEVSNKVESESELTKPKKKKAKKNKAPVTENDEENGVVAKKARKNEAVVVSASTTNGDLSEDILARYPVLKDEALVQRFMAVSMTNNQKGRIRQTLRLKLQDTTGSMLPDVVNNMLKATLAMETPDLRKVRILYNKLKQVLTEKTLVKEKKEKPVKNVKTDDTKVEKPQSVKKEKKENGTEEKKPEQKVKGPKRYVVFIGNLPLDISKEKILEHFSTLSDKIKDVRIPKPLENKKSAIAYLEVADEVTYEFALSKHHSMLDNRRINVLYSTQQNSKITKAEAKGKAAKLVAMQKSGQLAGSVPLDKKRSARRKKMKLAQKKAQEAA